MLDLLAMLLTRVAPFRHNDLADLNLYLERRNITNVGVIYLNFIKLCSRTLNGFKIFEAGDSQRP